MIYQKATFLKSAALLNQLPEDTGIEVAFAGRSNAGKSSAINSITNIKRLAHASKTPGRTQLINLFSLDETRRIVDLPGYGYAQVPHEVKERWQKTLARYLTERECLKGLMLMMDIRRPLMPHDKEMLDWAVRCSLPVHILLTKADKLSRTKMLTTLRGVHDHFSSHAPLVSVQIFSIPLQLGIIEAREQLDKWFFGGDVVAV